MDKLREIYDKRVTTPVYDRDGELLDILMDFEDLQQAIADYEASKWVSVDEERPEIAQIVNIVLNHDKEDVCAGFRATGGWYCFRLGEQAKQFIPNGTENVKVTHWQPLPTPPTK